MLSSRYYADAAADAYAAPLPDIADALSASHAYILPIYLCRHY